MHSGPDFIIIGAMKAATSTLHHQLSLQDGIFMSEPKEPNFFSDDAEYHRGINWYQNLFSNALDQDICGESSTHYTKLPTYPHTISRIKTHLSSLKFVYIIRHPIDRLVSHYIHEWSQNKIKCDINTAIEKHPELIEYSLYHKQILPFIETFGTEQVLVINFQQIIHEPQRVLEQVCHHIGFKKEPDWAAKEQYRNISSQRIRKFPLYEIIVNSKSAMFLRRSFVPKYVRKLIKDKFTMSQRPELSDLNLSKLKYIFDKDLEKLGLLIGSRLNCDNFTD